MTNPVARESTLCNSDGQPLMRQVMVYCPGCYMAHRFTVEVFDGYTGRGSGSPEPVWEWDGNLQRPTFSPSMLAYNTVHICKDEHPPEVCVDPANCGEKGHLVLNANDEWIPPPDARLLGHNTPHTRDPAWGNCHSFLRNGQWQFLGDSAHHLANQTVDMVALPDWLMPTQ